jgi:hypothetical protein
MSRRTLGVLLVLAVVAIGVWQIRPEWTRPPERPAGPGPVAAAPAPTAPAPAPSASGTRAAAEETYDLDADEARGGHTLARHVGRSDAQLVERLRRERNISAASTYIVRAIAERTIARTLNRNASRVSAWRARTGNRPNLALDYRGAPDEILGRSIRRGDRDPRTCSNAIVVLRWDGRGSYVLTSYPEPAR